MSIGDTLTLCVGCDKELNCIGSACPYSAHITLCDICNTNEANYIFDNDAYCDICAERFLKRKFNVLDIDEQAELFEIDVKVL